jgi:3-methyladenine DNA glycosylase AlkD
MTPEEALAELRTAADESRKPGMERVGINVDRALGVSIPDVRRIARCAGTDHALAQALWASDVHEARILATHVADPAAMSRAQMDVWARDVDSWDVADAAADLFAASRHRDEAIAAWARRDEPFVKRVAFATIARRAATDKLAGDDAFTAYFPVIRRGAHDDRNEVKKGVSWALRQIGKRNTTLYRAAQAEAQAMLDEAIETGSRGARWIARDVLRELRHPDRAARLAR